MKENARIISMLMCLCMTLMLLACVPSHADAASRVLTIPASVQEIEMEAFYKDTSIETVELPNGIRYIGPRAFALSSVKTINLPDSLKEIADDAFAGCSGLTASVTSGSYAMQWCIDHDIDYKAKMEWPESAHPYADEFDYTWTYTEPGNVEYLTLVFSRETKTESGCDFITLLDANGKQIGRYSGTQLSGKQIKVMGNTFSIRLTSDEIFEDANGYYGFKLENIQVAYTEALSITSVAAQSAAVAGGETICWNVETTGGVGEVTVAYEIKCGDKTVSTGSVPAGVQISYLPYKVGEYVLSVTVSDESGESLTDSSDAVTVTPTTVWPESSHPYANREDRTWIIAAENNVNNIILTFSSDTEFEGGCDYLTVYDDNNNQIARYSDSDLAGKTITVPSQSAALRLTSDGSVTKYGFRITKVDFDYVTPLSFTGITRAASKIQAGDTAVWTVEYTGGKNPVMYDYTITFGGKTVAQGTGRADEPIQYVPFQTGDYTLAVTLKDGWENQSAQKTSLIRTVARTEMTAVEDFTFATINGIQARITGYHGTGAVVTLPETVVINGLEYTVIEVADNVFKNKTNITSVIFPDTYISFGSNQFIGCTSLLNVDFGSLQTIGAGAFKNLKQNFDFDFPDTLRKIGDSAFEGCTSMTNIRLPEGVEYLGQYAFSDCDSLTEVHLSDSITHLGGACFAYCDNLSSINYPASLREMGSTVVLDGYQRTGVFYKTPNVHSITVPEGVTALPDRVFESSQYLTEVTLPNSLISIGDSAFDGCISIRSIVLPESVNYLGQFAFADCDGLTEIHLPDAITHLGGGCFAYCDNLSSINYPASLREMGKTAVMGSEWRTGLFYETPNVLTITVPEGVTALPDRVFESSQYLTEVTLPNSLISIGDSAFDGCISIRSIVLPESVNYLGQFAFADCDGLTEIHLPDAITHLGAGCFAYCDNLSSINYPASLREMGKTAVMGSEWRTGLFYKTPNVLTITVPEGVTALPDRVFESSQYLTEVTLPNSLISIGDSAFDGCISIRSIVLPESVNYLGQFAFADCDGLTEIYLPDAITHLGAGCFAYCDNLSSINYPASLREMGKTAVMGSGWRTGLFYETPNVLIITVPEGVTALPDRVFESSQYLTEVTLPNSLITIGDSAFSNCSSIERMRIPDKVTSIGQYAFQGCTEMVRIDIPESVTSIGRGAFDNCPNLKIFCEYGSCALDYAIKNSIPYYYLSLVNYWIPNGTIYKGEGNHLSGYIRSSDPIINAEVKLWNSSGTLIRSGTVSNGATDISLSAYLDSCISLPTLDLGKYTIEISALTEIEGETFLRTGFTVAKAPLRVSLSGEKLPNGLFRAGLPYLIKGTIRSNYSITSITAGVYDQNGAATSRVRTISPKQLTYDISALNNVLDFETLPEGAYQYRISVTADGKTVSLAKTTFSVGAAKSKPLTESDYQSMLNLVSDRSNKMVFARMDYYLEGLNDIGPGDLFTVAMVSGRSYVTSMFIDLFREKDQTDSYMVKLYKKQISGIIQEMADSGVSIGPSASDIKFFNKIGSSMTSITQKGMRKYLSEQEAELGVMYPASTYAGMLELGEMVDSFDFISEGISKYESITEFLEFLFEDYAANARILNTVANSMGETGNKSFDRAVREMQEDYNSKYIAYTRKALTDALNSLGKTALKALVESAAGFTYEIVDFALDIVFNSIDFSGHSMAERADNVMTFIAQIDTFQAASQAYINAFETVQNGDTSDSALQSLKINYKFALSSGTSLYETMKKLYDYTDAKYSDITEYIWRNLESFSLRYPAD